MNPPNDFVDYMGTPPQAQWGPPQPGGARWGQPTWYGTPPYVPPAFTWANLGGQYGGNFGQMVGGMVDQWRPPSSYGIWARPAYNQSAITAGQNTHNISTSSEVMRASAENLKQSIVDMLRNSGVQGNPEQLEAAASELGKTRMFQNLAGGYLSGAGASALVGALAGSSNGWTPSRREVQNLRGAFDAYYGFGANRTVDLSRTLGRSQDELAELLVESRRRMDPNRLAEERRLAKAEYEDFELNGLAEVAGKFGISKEAWKESYAKGGDGSAILDRLAPGDPDKQRDLGLAVSKAKRDKYGVAALGEEDVLNYRLMGGSKSLGRVVSDAKAMGFSGTPRELMQFYEETLGATDTIDDKKIEALSQRLRGISHSTGLMLRDLAHLTTAIQTGTDGLQHMSAGKAVGIVSAATFTAGDGRGFTSQELATMQGIIGQGLSEPMKSVGGTQSAALRAFAHKETYEKYLELAKKDPAAAEVFATNTMLSSPKMKIVTDMLARGDTATALTVIKDQQQNLANDVLRYNELVQKGGARTEAENKSMQLFKDILGQYSGITFDDKGTATYTEDTQEVRAAASAEARESMSFVAGSGEVMRNLGATLAPDASQEKQEAVAALYMDTLGRFKDTRRAMASVREMAGKNGIRVAEDPRVDVTQVGRVLSEFKEAAGGEARALQMLDTMAAGVVDPARVQENQERAEKASLYQRAGDVGKTMSSVLRGGGAAGGAEGVKYLLGASGMKGPLLDFFNATLGLKEEDRAKRIEAAGEAAEAQAWMTANEYKKSGTEDEKAEYALHESYLNRAAATMGKTKEEVAALFGDQANMAAMDRFVDLSGVSGKPDKSEIKIMGELTIKRLNKDGTATADVDAGEDPSSQQSGGKG